VTIFDYLVFFVLICSVIISMLRGLVKEVLSLASWVIAFVVANAYGEALAAMLPDGIPGESTKLIVGFIALFIGTRLLMALLSRAVQEMVKASGLSLIDRSLGAVFGLARGVMIVLAVVLLCGTTSIPQQPFWKDALLSPQAVSAAETVKLYLPGQFAQHVHF
jgi:membrane protein required for colicin V production